MSSQPSLSILLLTTGRIARADFTTLGTPAAGVWSAPRSHDSTPVDAVRAALALGGRLGSVVWVLFEDAWIQNIDLSKGQVSGLSPEQIGRALSFEVESFSGMAVGESALGFSDCGERDGVKSYWIVELAAGVRDAMQQAIVAAGGKLAGVCHPGGVPRPVDPANAGHAWRRLEAWNGGMLWLECDVRQHIRTRVLTAPPALLQSAPGAGLELLTVDAATAITNPDPSASAKRFALDDEAQLREWFDAWGGALHAGRPSVPVVAPRAPKPTPRKYILTGVVLEAAMIFLFGLAILRGTLVRNRLQAERAEITRANEKIQTVVKTNTALRKEIADLELQVEKRAMLTGRRDSIPALLRALASTRPDDVVLSNIRPGGASSMIVNGIALEAISVDEMSVALTTMLRSEGWYAQPLQKIAKRTLPNSGPWEFSISVSQEDPKPVAPAPKRAR